MPTWFLCIEQTISSHDYSRPDIHIGILAAKLALGRFSSYDHEKLAGVVKTDMYGVDAILFLTGCTESLYRHFFGETATESRALRFDGHI